MKTTTTTKKEYRQPQIVEMGDALETTLAGFFFGNADGGPFPINYWPL